MMTIKNMDTKINQTRLGIHILLNLFGCNENQLKEINIISKLVNEAVSQSGLTKVGESFHQFKPHGVTGVLLLSESHICIHTWPEYKSAAIDIFCCGSEEKARQVCEIIVKQMSPEKVVQEVLYR